MWRLACMNASPCVRTKKYSEASKTSGTASGALLPLKIVNGIQQAITLSPDQALSDGVDTHITARLRFQPTSFAATRLT